MKLFKKVTSLLLVCTAATATFLALTAESCSEPAAEEHTHDWNEWVVTTEATCETAGSKTRTCKLDATHVETEEIPATGHTYGEWVVTTPATCTADGVKTKTCACGDTQTEAIPATGHDYDTEFTVDNAATCTAVGSKSKHCKNCDSKTEVTEIPATGHTYGEWVVTTPATCTADGVKTKTCACGDTQTEAIPATEHDWNEWVVTTEANCETAGSKTRICKHDATHVETEEIPALAHKNATSVASAATDQTVTFLDGSTVKFVSQPYYECPDCNKKFADAECKYEITAVMQASRRGVIVSEGVNKTAKTNVSGGAVFFMAKENGKFTFVFTDCKDADGEIINSAITQIGVFVSSAPKSAFSGDTWATTGDYYARFDNTSTAPTDKVVVSLNAGEGIYIINKSNYCTVTVSRETPKNIITAGQNTVEVTVANSAIDTDSYGFTPTETKTYSMTVPAGVYATIDGVSFIDASESAAPVTKNFDATVGRMITFSFGSAKVGSYTVNIGDKVMPTISTADTYTVATYPDYNCGETVSVAAGVEEGDYTFTFEGGAGMGRCSFYFILNWDGTSTSGNESTGWYYISANCSFKVTLHCKAGDTLTLFNSARGTGPSVIISMEKVQAA